jgi:hypothetical protein
MIANPKSASPKRAPSTSPGPACQSPGAGRQRPGNTPPPTAPSPEGAVFGGAASARGEGVPRVLPFQGVTGFGDGGPRALPWADESLRPWRVRYLAPRGREFYRPRAGAQKIGVGMNRFEPILVSDFGAARSTELNSPPAVSAPVPGGVAEPEGLLVCKHGYGNPD